MDAANAGGRVNLTPPQVLALHLADEGGLHWWPGGRWTSVPWTRGRKRGRYRYRIIPEDRWVTSCAHNRSVETWTVRCLGKRGLLEHDPDSIAGETDIVPWKLTDAGRAALAEVRIGDRVTRQDVDRAMEEDKR